MSTVVPMTMIAENGAVPTSINGARVVAVAEMDVENVTKRGCYDGFCAGTLTGLMIGLPIFGICAAPLTRVNARDKARVTQLILTEEALVLRIGDHLTSCRCLCCGCAEGAFEKVVPLDRVTDLSLSLPGQGCVDVRCPLSTVLVQTAGSGFAEIVVTGIRDAQQFKDLVMKTKKAVESLQGNACAKDEFGVSRTPAGPPHPTVMSMTAPPAAVVADPEVAPLLREIRDVLVRIERQGTTPRS